MVLMADFTSCNAVRELLSSATCFRKLSAAHALGSWRADTMQPKAEHHLLSFKAETIEDLPNLTSRVHSSNMQPNWQCKRHSVQRGPDTART